VTPAFVHIDGRAEMGLYSSRCARIYDVNVWAAGIAHRGGVDKPCTRDSIHAFSTMMFEINNVPSGARNI
jgi:hypothetical protein